MSMEAEINTLNLILLVFVILVFWRLKSVLGFHDGFTRRPKPPPEQSADLLEKPSKPSQRPNLRVVGNSEGDDDQQSLMQITKIDKTFELSSFLEGVSKAYEIILTAYAVHDRQRLQELVSEEVMAGFEAAIKEREAQGYSLETQTIGASVPEIHDVELDGKLARITVMINAELCSVVRDSAGAVVKGSPEQIIQTKDYWTFERHLKNRSPIWKLVATESR